MLGAWLPVSIQPTLQRRASKCQDDDDGDDEDTNSDDDDDDDEEDNDDDDDDDGRYVLANCRANLVVVEDQKQLAKILEVRVIIIIFTVIILLGESSSLSLTSLSKPPPMHRCSMSDNLKQPWQW